MAQFKEYINKLASGAPLSAGDAANAFEALMSGEATPAQVGGFLMALRVRGETVDEITGAVRVMRAKMLRVDAPDEAIDIVGTGGDASGTYNISTCSAFVVAGVGVPVAKHGNRALSSKSGAADVLSALGVNIDVQPAQIERCLHEANLGFMFAPAHHAAMRHVMPARQELATRTIFNLLGPLSNPAGTRRQVVGVFDRHWIVPLAETLKNLGADHIWVVHGSDGLDELTTTGPTHVAELKNGHVRTFEVSPADAGLKCTKPQALKGADAQVNARAIRAILSGEPGAFRDVVLLNAAAALIVAGRSSDLAGGARLAAEAIDSGAAMNSLDKLVAISNS